MRKRINFEICEKSRFIYLGWLFFMTLYPQNSPKLDSMLLKLGSTTLSLLLVLSLSYGQKSNPPSDIKETDFKLGTTLSFQSSILEEERHLNVYLPAGYEANDTLSYPVIYLLDGSADEDFIHIVGLLQFANFPWVELFPPSIVVGIANVDRKRDFTYPTNNAKDKEDFPTTGGSAAFIKCLQEEIQVLINQTYRTNGQGTLIGQSLGGLLATEILFKKPSLFTHYMIISPSLWWDDQSLLSYTPECLSANSSTEVAVFVAVGKEGKIMESTAKALASKLKTSENQAMRSWFHYMGDQGHANILHLAIYKAMELMKETY